MGHPPDIDGDLTLENFLDIIIKHTKYSPPKNHKKIIKLDFKSMKAFEASLPIVKSFASVTKYPEGIFLNADILEGDVVAILS
jgi:hypothetical protein